ncbi:CoA-binding protein [Pontiellaceae bacterium B1224]|nr:CoA-binding protein [Pontiellaceae bacterium B1224]
MNQNTNKHTVAVLGASPKPERYSNKAIRLLLEHGHEVVPVHPAIEMVEGLPVRKSLSKIVEPIDTLTVYVSEKLSTPIMAEIIQLKPGRVIFNPGTENAALYRELEAAGISFEEACTLVLLNSGQF